MYVCIYIYIYIYIYHMLLGIFSRFVFNLLEGRQPHNFGLTRIHTLKSTRIHTQTHTCIIQSAWTRHIHACALWACTCNHLHTLSCAHARTRTHVHIRRHSYERNACIRTLTCTYPTRARRMMTAPSRISLLTARPHGPANRAPDPTVTGPGIPSPRLESIYAWRPALWSQY